MKNVVYFIFGLSLSLLLSSCVTFRGGVNFASEKSEIDSPGIERSPLDTKNQLNISNTSSETGFYIGVAFRDEFLELSDDFAIQPEINFVAIKDLNQIQVPILAKYTIVDKLNAYAGPNLGFLFDTPDGIKSFNFAVDVGLSYDVTDNILVEARYDYGLSNLFENGNSNFSTKLRNFQVGLAYRFDD